jgi:hypothetical protein
MADIDVVWPFIVWLCIGYAGITVAVVALALHVQRRNKEVDKFADSYADWAVAITNKVNQIKLTKDGPPTPSMKSFMQLVKDEERTNHE